MLAARATPTSPPVASKGAPRAIWVRVVALLGGFAAAVALRVAVGGVAVAQSASAGWVFAGCLLALSVAGGVSGRPDWRSVPTGLGVGVLLCVPVGAGQLLAQRPLHDASGFWSWALVVSVVATAEELFLRGALHDAVDTLAGSNAAVALGSAAFALLHVPLYGWHVLPLDLAVGVVLGGLRVRAGTWAAPAVAHVAADLASWFLR